MESVVQKNAELKKNGGMSMMSLPFWELSLLPQRSGFGEIMSGVAKGIIV